LEGAQGGQRGQSGEHLYMHKFHLSLELSHLSPGFATRNNPSNEIIEEQISFISASEDTS
ncbi:MAG: hypothetical protein RLW42_12470, partial [Gammaproteobacteria bacterium]